MISEAATVAYAAREGTPSPAPAAAPRLAVIVPCFNEVESLDVLVAALERLEDELAGRYVMQLLFVDDGSRDGTYEELKRIYVDRSNALVVRHRTNRGIAAAIATGIAHANAEIAASLDADCTYDPAVTIPALLDRLTDDVDMVVASPYHPAGSVVGVPRWRLALSKAASRCYGQVLRNQLHTYTSCVRVFRRSALEGLPPTQGGFVGIVELLWHLDRRGGRIAEAPAILRVRTTGHSKMRLARTIVAHGKLLLKAAGHRLFGGAKAASNELRTNQQLMTHT